MRSISYISWFIKHRLAKPSFFYIKENISLPVSLVDLFKWRLYIFVISAVLGQKSDDPLHIDNILNVFVFKKTPVSKGQASLRRKKRQKNSSSKISFGTDATDESTGHKQQHQVSQGNFSKRFSGIHIYFIILWV